MKTTIILFTITIVILLGLPGCATNHPMPENYYQYRTSDTPILDLWDSGIQVVPNVKTNRCTKVPVRGPQSWMGVKYYEERCK